METAKISINKGELIGYLKEIKGKIDINKAIKKSDNEKGNNGIGTNQFRELASLCKNAEVYEEIELLIRYKMAKAKQSESWNVKKNDENSIGEIILCYMDKINTTYSRYGDEIVLKALSLFFGYFYQIARVWKETESGQEENKCYLKSLKIKK